MQNRIRYLLLFTMSLVFFLSAIPAVNAFEGISAGNFQMEENSPGAADLEIKTYQDIPYTGQFPASVGEAGGEVSVVKQPRKGTVVLDGEDFYKVLLGILEPNETVILSTHLLEEVEPVISRAILMRSGEIIGDVTAEELQEQGTSLMQYVKQTYHYRADRVGKALRQLSGEED